MGKGPSPGLPTPLQTPNAGKSELEGVRLREITFVVEEGNNPDRRAKVPQFHAKWERMWEAH